MTTTPPETPPLTPPETSTGKVRKTGNHLTDESRAICLARIMESRIVGSPNMVTLAKELGITKTTAYRLLDELARDNQDSLVAHRLLLEYRSRTERLAAEMMSKAQEADQRGDHSVAAKYRADRAGLLNQTFERLQSAGFLPKRDDKVALSGSVDFKIPLEPAIAKALEEMRKKK